MPEDDDRFGEEQATRLAEILPNDRVSEAADKIKGTIKAVVSNAKKLTPDGVPEDDDRFGEEQATKLAEILKGLKDGPNDNRW